MIEDFKTVKKVEAKAGSKGTYWAVTWADDKKDNIFNVAWLPLLKQSQEEQVPLRYTKEKKGNFFNIVSLELAVAAVLDKTSQKQSDTGIVAAPEEGLESEKPKEPPKEKENRTKDESIERAVWIKELGEGIRSGEIDKATPLGISLRKAYYAEMLRVLNIRVPIDNRLVEEAKKMGAKEIK